MLGGVPCKVKVIFLCGLLHSRILTTLLKECLGMISFCSKEPSVISNHISLIVQRQFNLFLGMEFMVDATDSSTKELQRNARL